MVEGMPQVMLTTATVTPAVRQLLDKPDQLSAPKKVYGTQSSEDYEDDEDSDPNAVKIALPRDIRIITAPGLHHVVPCLKRVFVNVGSADKLSLLVDVVAGGERRKRDERRENNEDEAGNPLPLTLAATRAQADARLSTGWPSRACRACATTTTSARRIVSRTSGGTAWWGRAGARWTRRQVQGA